MHGAALLDDHRFRTGLAFGAAALLVIVCMVLVVRRSAPASGAPPGKRSLRRRPPVAGVALVAAATLALDRSGSTTLLSGRLVLGLVLLVIGPFVAAVSLGDLRGGPWVTALAAVPGAAVVASAASAVNHLGWIPPLVLATTVVGGAVVADFDRANERAGLGPVLIAIAVLGMYSALPDTEQVIVVLGAAIPIAFLGSPVAVAALGPGAYASVGLLAWVAAVGGRGRPGAVIGAIACLGLMLVEPVVRRAARGRLRSPRSPRSVRTVLVIVLQGAVVLVAARVAGLETSATRAAAISAGALLVSAAALVVVLAPGRPTGPDPPGRPGGAQGDENAAIADLPPLPPRSMGPA